MSYPARMPTARASSTVTTARDALIADPALGGRALCRALSQATDEVLATLWHDAAASITPTRRRSAVALVAVGGYGRGELAPQSDIDVLLVHDGKVGGIAEAATALWYPLWDAGLKLGHAVRSLDDQLALAGDDLDTATATLSVRHLAGDEELAARLATEGRARWRRHGRRWLDTLRSKVIERRTQAGDVAFLLEPDLKDGHGGLRDVQTLWWAADADLLVPPDDLAQLDECYGRLVDVRVALHRVTGRPGDTLRLEDQDAVADAVGATSADALMAEVAAAARTIGWIADGAWRRMSRHQLGHEERAGEGLVVVDREVELAARADPVADPVLVLRAARVAAQRDVPLSRATLDRLAAEVDAGAWADRWPPGRGQRARAAAVAGAAGDRRARVARPARHPRAPAARVGGRPQPPAAQRLPPLHRRPAPVGDGGERGQLDRRASPVRTCCCSVRCSTTSARGTPATTPRPAWRSCAPSPRGWGCRRTTSPCSWRWSSTTCCCPTWRSAATSPTRRRSDASPTPSAARGCSSCSPR